MNEPGGPPSDRTPQIRPTTIGAWSLDLRSGAITWGPGLRDILGLPAAAEASTASFEAQVHEIDRPLRQAALAAIGGTGATDYFA